MSKAKNLNEGIVTALANTDLVIAADSAGSLRPISLSNLLKAIRSNLGIARLSVIDLKGGEWVRFAKLSTPTSSFCGILTLSHPWYAGKPCPLLCFVNGSSKKEINAEKLTKGSFYNANTDNQGLSFTAVRVVDVDGSVYVEARFKGNGATASSVLYSISGQINLELIDATISTAEAANVLKEIDLSGG